jgi:hypothetical protein
VPISNDPIAEAIAAEYMAGRLLGLARHDLAAARTLHETEPDTFTKIALTKAEVDLAGWEEINRIVTAHNDKLRYEDA